TQCIACSATNTIQIDTRTPSSVTALDEANPGDAIGKSINHTGSVQLTFEVPESCWYNIYIHASDLPTTLRLDGNRILHGVLPAKGPGPVKNTNVVTSIYISAGAHTLSLSRSWFTGLPHIRELGLVSIRGNRMAARIIPTT